ncbi:transglycosylase SLT domain-containing protein [Acidovorax sp. SUPP2522]|uniref:transglycosylase SLT domain-containing protein n=1 Tax=unclassified Acidovorax TaxID=2684926 RepID=UPI00234B7C28|nr:MULTISPECIES: transglycosylase SLT domain-containing protein [unclassified Acidovorax]WCM99779.1 transglycosylase SLT domain-containing protein [Acidovorax sp. GBBC 1281]GKT14378.1 transglycosylase SLT domain-containing protein [Acidovorax sp. SUPP2522]
MKILHILGLASVVWLTGCATQGTSPGSAANKDGSAPATTDTSSSSSHTPLIPSGPLQPISAVQASNGEVASLYAPSDLWDRIRRGFAMPDLDQDLVRDREQWYATRPDYMQRMTERSSKYLFHIVEELELRGMPTELALLPYIESAFNPQAVSSAKAAGMWQFMPATGSDYQLKQNAFRDDRRDVLASTRAALDYLQRLYGMFGDWHLALAAYNWGEGSVSRAIARNQKLGLGTSYTELTMPAETRMYVPKLQAVKNIVANPQAFRTELPLIENHPYFQTVDITHDIDVSLVASLAGVREEDFRALNPSLHRPVILAAGMPQILLPWDNAKVFLKNLEAHREGQYASWTVWSVPTTMTVATAAQRVGMSENDLRSVNRIPPRMMIKAGSALMVPRATTTRQDVSSQVADNGQVAFTPEIVTRRTTVRAGKRDSVASIANRYKVSAANVAEWNDVKANAAFKAGQQVVMYLPVKLATTSSARPAIKQTSTRGAKAPAAPTRKGETPSRKKR